MISEQTLQDIYSCYREIRVGNKLLEQTEKIVKDPDAPKLKDAFGRQRNLQLGIPCGESAHQLLEVSWSLATAVIKSHIANKEAELKMLNEKAKIELETEAKAGVV